MEDSVMLLCDIGNTSYHFSDSRSDYKEDVKTFNPKTIQTKVYYICVNPNISSVLDSLDNWIDLAQYIDMKDYYATMGIDRIVASQAIDDGIIIDAGSAITVDIVTDGNFKGGFIYPGTVAMNKAYSDISSALDYTFNYDIDLYTLPKNSTDAISYGFLKTLYLEVISHNKDIFITGGDAEKMLCIFKNAKVEKELIFNGMKKILAKVL